MKKSALIISFGFLFYCSLFSQKFYNLNQEKQIPYKEINIDQGHKLNVHEASRLREFFINDHWLNGDKVQKNDTILLDLFIDKQYLGVVDQINLDINKTITIRARVVDYMFGSCIISINNMKLFMAITLPENNELFVSRYLPQSDRYYLLEIDKTKSRALEDAPSLVPILKKSQDTSIVPVFNKDPFQLNNHNSNHNITDANINQSNYDTITVMVVYTPAASDWANTFQTSINNTIGLIMEQSQMVLDNSNTLTVLRLVYSDQVDYIEQNNSHDLELLAGNGDGYMDEVHLWRNTYCADVVVLLEEINFAGGIAFLLSSTNGEPDIAFSITRVQQPVNQCSTIHEIGHNLGCHHHKLQNFQPGPGLFSYSAGWRWDGLANIKYCSIMTYESGSYFPDGIDAVRVPYFSNPGVNFQSVPTGEPVEGDNAKTIREIKGVTSNYRSGCCCRSVVSTVAASNVTQNNAMCGGIVLSGGSGIVTSRGVCWNTSPGPTTANYKTIDGSGIGTFTSTVTGLLASTTYYIRAYAINYAGVAYGNEVTLTTTAPVMPTVTTSFVTNITQFSANCGGSIISSGGGTVSSRGVCWNTTQTPTISDFKTVDGSGAGTFTSLITGLVPNSPYFLRAYATNEVGTSYGNQVTFTTLPYISYCDPIEINHLAGNVSPVNKLTSYEIVTNLPGEPLKYWITSNLGSDHQASSVNDSTEASAGWYWQFNRKQGFKYIGSTRIPNSTWITNINENSDWLSSNDPCTSELGNSWHIPTSSEWYNVDAAGGWSTWNQAWNSALRLHAGGYLLASSGVLNYRGLYGYFWSSTQNSNSKGNDFVLSNGFCITGSQNKPYGFSLRCLTEIPCLLNTRILNGTVTETACYDASQSIIVGGNGSTFIVESGASSTLISGQFIYYLPGSKVVNGGYMHGIIMPNGPFCVSPSSASISSASEDYQATFITKSFKIYPNPTNGRFFIESTRESDSGKVVIELYGFRGDKIMSEKINLNQKYECSLINRPAGVYFLKIITRNFSETIKIVKV